MQNSRRLVAALCMLGALFAPRAAYAFTEPRSYVDEAADGGGGGRWFTGSPAEGYGCGVCHTGPGPERLEVSGLPDAGYVPGQRYDIRLSWPDIAERAEARRDDGEEAPRTSVVVELVAETGVGSGVIEVAAADEAREGELCILPEGEQAAQLFFVRPGEETVEEEVLCEASELGQRCVIATLACGASELRFTWTAPAEWQDAIYFSAGLVSADEVSGDPEDDAVTELSRVLSPAASMRARHETEIEAGCAARPGRGAGAGGVGAAMVTLFMVVWRRRRRP